MCMFCFNCGACGKKVPEELQAYYNSFKACSVCGTELELGQTVCPNCHHSVIDTLDEKLEDERGCKDAIR